MKILFVNPMDRSEDFPRSIPFQIAVLASVADSAGHKLDVMDLNAFREVSTDEGVLDTIRDGKEYTDYDVIWVDSSFRTLGEARHVINLLRSKLPEAVTVLAGSAATAMPREALKLVDGLDVAVFGHQEETFVEVVERAAGQRWEPVAGVAFRQDKGIRQNAPRLTVPDLEQIPFPNYRFIPIERYFQFSPMPICQEALVSKRRLSFSWQRGSMFPSPERAVKNIVEARYKYAIDFASLVDQGIMSDPKWFGKFVDAYMEEGLHEIVPWSFWVRPDKVPPNPDIIRAVKDAGCRAVFVGIETRSELEDPYLKLAVEHFKRVGVNMVLRFTVGGPGQSVDDVVGMAFLSFANKLETYEVSPPNLYPDGPYYEDHFKEILEPYDGDLGKMIGDEARNSPVSWKDGLDFVDVIALKALVRTRDIDGILRFSHARPHPHSVKWAPQCPVCKQVSKEAVQVAKASKGLNVAVAESRLPPGASLP